MKQANGGGIQQTLPPPSPVPALWETIEFTHSSGARHDARPTIPRVTPSTFPTMPKVIATIEFSLQPGWPLERLAIPGLFEVLL
jgi:hypothetical protein